MRQEKYYGAYPDDYDKVIVFVSRNSHKGVSNKFYLRDDQGHFFDLHVQSIGTAQNNYNKYTLTLYDPIEIGVEYQVIHQYAQGMVLKYSGIVETERSDEQFFYDGDDLGYTYGRDRTAFTLWVPTISRVKLEVCRNNRLYTYEVKQTDKGVYRCTILENLESVICVYLVRVNGVWRKSIDPYGTASTENSRRSAVVDLDKIRTCDVPLPKVTGTCDIITYETSVRDFTVQKGIGVTIPGKFRGFVEENEITGQQCSGFSYLKTLRTTHIQLMPATDFGSVDENYPLMHHSWDYDPVQYRALEGSFSTEPANPYGRMFELTKLIEECYKQGVRVSPDVVFDHVYDRETHAFESTVPSYHLQVNENGDFSNDTYCGNDVGSRRNMCHKYIMDVCTYLVRTYHINDFHSDLMGILDVATINTIYGACKALNPDFIVYGKGWDMPSLLDSGERASISNNAQMPHVAHFSDRFRNIVKGRANTNEVSVKGYCIGAVYLLDITRNCLSGNYTDIGMEPMFTHPRSAVNYVECHDNTMSQDKLRECCKESSKKMRVTRTKMLMMAVLLAQGIPLIHSGQEFARSKHGLLNIYEENDEVNKLDYLRRSQYQDMVKITEDLIRIRKERPTPRYSMEEGAERRVSFSDIVQKVLLYKIRGEHDNMVITFNPAGEYFFYEFEAAYPLLCYNGASENIPIKKVDIEPYNAVVFSRNDFLRSGIR